MIASNIQLETVEEITERGTELKERVLREYLEGASLWSLRNKYARLLSTAVIRRLLDGVVRPTGGPLKSDLSEAEIAAARDKIKEGWSPEVASRRWVGRYLSKPETLGEALSKQLNQISRSYR